MEIFKCVSGVHEALMQDVDRRPPVICFIPSPEITRANARFLQFLWPAGLGWLQQSMTSMSLNLTVMQTLPEFVPQVASQIAA